ncbi:hypothetical protein LUZ60_013578 [Juncus effusus]|nr:hypothetical protein LUZ60_013578 [Juncus effusus]
MVKKKKLLIQPNPTQIILPQNPTHQNPFPPAAASARLHSSLRPSFLTRPPFSSLISNYFSLLYPNWNKHIRIKSMLSFLTRHGHSIPLAGTTRPSSPSPASPLLFRLFSSLISPTTTSSSLCPGCGVHMQSESSSLPGYFTVPSSTHPSSSPPPLSFPFLSSSLKSGVLSCPQSDHSEPDYSSSHSPTKTLVCARCHSLRHYGRVKNPSAENLLPNFDFQTTVGPRLASASGAPSVVLLIADASDFDGSFPKGVSRLISASIDSNTDTWKHNLPSNLPRPVLVVSKADLLPKLPPGHLADWARKRARACGLTVPICGVHTVSATRNWGVKELLDRVQQLAGQRGNVWAVGAQNVGKSTLINSMAKWGPVGSGAHLTEAPVPGTTLGIVKVEGVLEGRAKLFDTPGILNPGQITTRLSRDEQKLVNVSKPLRPRTYRVKKGQSIHLGGLARVDIEELSVETIYITVWASLLLPLHMGKTEHASSMIENHFGLQLQPPIGQERVKELGKWVRKEIKLSGETWDKNCADVAVSGLGWVGIGLKGEAVLGVWTYEGVEVVLRGSVLHRRAPFFEEPGFSVCEIVSKADREKDRLKRSNGERKKKVEGFDVSMASDAAVDA